MGKIKIEQFNEVNEIMEKYNIESLEHLEKILKSNFSDNTLYRVQIEIIGEDDDQIINNVYSDINRALELYDKYRYTQFACGTLINHTTNEVISSYCNDWEISSAEYDAWHQDELLKKNNDMF